MVFFLFVQKLKSPVISVSQGTKCLFSSLAQVPFKAHHFSSAEGTWACNPTINCLLRGLNSICTIQLEQTKMSPKLEAGRKVNFLFPFPHFSLLASHLQLAKK